MRKIAARLQLTFRTAGGSRRTISIEDPKTNLTDVEVQAAMDTIIAKNIFGTSDGDLVGVVSAQIVTTEVQEFNVM
ncbi:MAG: Uncharacterized protein XD50_1309 [Clostridia bacterium 41_269]|nr:MAG: Uncharacterized protein XD50_1309 [Clostridia bacterium 41_269]